MPPNERAMLNEHFHFANRSLFLLPGHLQNVRSVSDFKTETFEDSPKMFQMKLLRDYIPLVTEVQGTLI